MRYENGQIIGRYSLLRPVQAEDAAFIVSLRTNPQLSRYISATDSSVESQRKWIEGFLQRANRGLEYYFIVCDLEGTSWGTVRLYDIKNQECTGGSWLMTQGSPLSASFESYLAPMFLAFEILQLNVMHIDVRRDNKRVWRWHESCGAVFVRETDIDRYYDYPRAVYPEVSEKIYKLLTPFVPRNQ